MFKLLGHLVLGPSLAATITARAEGSLRGSGSDYTRAVGMRGAVENRREADRLYRKAEKDEHESRRRHDPELHRQAVREVRQARLADGQGRGFARAALQALTASLLAGEMSKAESQSIDVNQLKEIANTPNPLDQQLTDLMGEQTLGANDTGDAAFVEAAVADKLPTAADAKTESVAAKDKAGTGDPASASPVASGGAGQTTGAFGGVVVNGAKGGSPVVAANSLRPLSLSTDEAAGGGGGPSLNERADQIERDRKVFLKKMGVGRVPASEVRAEKDANIFEVVHARYQTMRGANSFMEYLERQGR